MREARKDAGGPEGLLPAQELCPEADPRGRAVLASPLPVATEAARRLCWVARSHSFQASKHPVPASSLELVSRPLPACPALSRRGRTPALASPGDLFYLSAFSHLLRFMADSEGGTESPKEPREQA